MLQSEVVERMVAAPGSSEYGRLSVMLQYRFDMEKVLDVPADAFPAAAQSRVGGDAHDPAAGYAACARATSAFSRTLSRTAFSQRRKTLRNTLGGVLTTADFATLGIDPQARAQTLSVEDFVKIADYRVKAATSDR